MINSTHVKAHRSAAGGKGGANICRLSAARAEDATRKSDALADVKGRLIAILLTGAAKLSRCVELIDLRDPQSAARSRRAARQQIVCQMPRVPSEQIGYRSSSKGHIRAGNRTNGNRFSTHARCR